MPITNLRCNIDEDAFSLAVFITRLLTGGVLLYVSAGCLLYYREFLYNAAAIGLPLPVPAGLTVAVAELFLGLFLILGWFTRPAAVLSFLCTSAMGIIFLAADINKLYVALLVLLAAALVPAALLGPGKISLDYKHALRRAQKTYRG